MCLLSRDGDDPGVHVSDGSQQRQPLSEYPGRDGVVESTTDRGGARRNARRRNNDSRTDVSHVTQNPRTLWKMTTCACVRVLGRDCGGHVGAKCSGVIRVRSMTPCHTFAGRESDRCRQN